MTNQVKRIILGAIAALGLLVLVLPFAGISYFGETETVKLGELSELVEWVSSYSDGLSLVTVIIVVLYAAVIIGALIGIYCAYSNNSRLAKVSGACYALYALIGLLTPLYINVKINDGLSDFFDSDFSIVKVGFGTIFALLISIALFVLWNKWGKELAYDGETGNLSDIAGKARNLAGKIATPGSSRKTWVCPECGAQNDNAHAFCISCGHSKPKAATCPHCGAELIPNAQFCNSCGKPVGTEGVANTVSQNTMTDITRTNTMGIAVLNEDKHNVEQLREKIRQLKEMVDEGLLAQEEYEKMKQDLISNWGK